MDTLNKNEEWIGGYEYFYSIDTDANITSWSKEGKRKIIMKHVLQSNGYVTISLSKVPEMRGYRTKLIQSIMKDAFMMKDCPGKHYVITHNDRDYTNNKLSNLRWEHRSKVFRRGGGGRGKKPVTVIDLETGLKCIYPGTVECARALRTKGSDIKDCNATGQPLKNRYLIHQHKSLKA